MRLAVLLLLFSAATAAAGGAPAEAKMGHVTGIGGVFFKVKDQKALAAWYRDTLGIEIEEWGGAALKTDVAGRPSVAVFGMFKSDTKYFEPSTKEFMINLSVDDLDAMITHIEAKGVKVLGRDDSDPNGRFAWILDPEGTKIELWQEIKAAK